MVWDFKLSEEEIAKIDSLDQKARFFDPKQMEGYGWNYLAYYE